MTNLNMNTQRSEITLSEEYVQDCFHSYLKSSLAQVKAEGLLDITVLSSAESDLMITGTHLFHHNHSSWIILNVSGASGPALCLYFAALRSVTDPPSVPLPRRSKTSEPPTDLSFANCPPTFRSFLIVWSQNVPLIQALPPEYQHDLARIICGLEPISQPLNRRLNAIAADLRAVAIEISMRRTFQDKYAGDLQAAIDAGARNNSGRVKASFIPPPAYAFAPQFPSPISTTDTKLPLPSILGPDAPAIEFIRETLYAALGEVLERMPALRRLLHTDPSRAYFASVAFAILDVATSSSTYSVATKKSGELPTSSDRPKEPTIRGVLGQRLTLSDCPSELRPFMTELCEIGKAAHEMEEEDSAASIAALLQGKEPPHPRLDRVHHILEGGVGHVYNERRPANGVGHSSDTRSPDPRRRKTSTENRAVAFANRINALALGMTALRAFRERQELVFKVLAGIGQ